MSYCRWSDYIESDIYCYENPKGVVIAVAKNRFRVQETLPELHPMSDPPTRDDWLIQAKILADVREIRQHSPMEPIGLPYDGAYILCDTFTEAANKLIELFDLGYNVPLYAIELLHEDAKEAG